MSRPGPSFLDRPDLQLLMFGGKGGVGKTTCAVAAALRMSTLAPARSLLLVSTDPAHSVRDCLADSIPPANLKVLEFDARQYLSAFRDEAGPVIREIAAAGTFLDDEDIDQFLNLSLPGLDELMAFLEISAWVELRRYEQVIVDTAPSGHTLRLLEMPEMIRKWLSMLEALLAKRRYMRRVFSRDASPGREDLFVAGRQSTLRQAENLLRDAKRCQFVPVTIADRVSVEETLVFCGELLERRIPVAELVVNQLHSDGNGCDACSAAAAAERRQIERLAAGLTPPRRVWEIGLMEEEVRGPESLAGFWNRARLADRETASAPLGATDGDTAAVPPDAADREAAVQDPAPPPSERMKLVLVAGKGGVGKTTLASITALRLAHDFPEKRVLLLSTDPAHSLSASLEIGIGSRPAEILPGLTALEIDARAQFERLKARYAEDVERFLETISRGFDLTFDRVVLERMMDLAPPGLDEVMALTRILDFLDTNAYDLFVLDCAATGHLIRLLELPDLINDWLKTFFNLFLKYENILRLPGFAGELVRISRNLKKLRQLLRNPAASALYAVTIPTQMAIEETRDLVDASRRLGVWVPQVFVNLVTPPADCRLCSSLRARESLAAGSLRQLYPDKHVTLVYRQPDITGQIRRCRRCDPTSCPVCPYETVQEKEEVAAGVAT